MKDKESLKEFKEQVQLKKVLIGGYDRKDVQMKFDIFYEMVEIYIDEQKKEFEAKIDTLTRNFENKLKASDFLVVELNRNISSLTEENEALVIKQHKMKEAYKEYCESILNQYSSSLCSLSNEFSRMMDSVSNMQKEIMNKDINEGLTKALVMKMGSELTNGEDNEEKN